MKLAIAASFASLLLVATPACAADEEIQVYMNEINLPHEWGLDVHVNDVTSGDRSLDYPGAESSIGRIRVTPEFSWGLTNDIELGAYLPLTTLASDGVYRVQGAKLRIKWLGRHVERGFYYGLNYEIGRTARRLDRNPWNNEIKLIGGWEGDKWQIGANANFDFALSGPAKGPADVQVASKIGYKLTENTLIGIESYNGVGTVRDPAHFGASEQATFVALDVPVGRWSFNAGVGKGYGTNPDNLIVKFIISVPIGR